ncbi:hypothetical protein KAI58_04370 [Candidatus Gracilibacteria bacterium]|nr:hypothetical protein [Candidatus Gracilibacteria bacterium]
MNYKILVYGSLAFDVIFSIPEDFRTSIPLENGKIRNFNATYIANEKQEFRGGTAGNIAFWLGKESIKSSIFSAWGKDFNQKGYREKLEDLGIKIKGFEGEFSAHAYIVSDPLHQQLVIWQPNAYEQNETQNLSDQFSDEDLEGFEYAIFSPGTPSSLLKHMKEFRKKNKTAIIFFDPGQVAPFFEAENFQKCCILSDVLVGNDIEFQHFNNYGIPKNMMLLETLGGRGVRFIQENKEVFFSAEKVEKVVETTGAGDAFRAGVLASLLQKKSWEESIRNGIKLGAKCVKLPSGQE